jgi:GT2 family glycosyltransferase
VVDNGSRDDSVKKIKDWAVKKFGQSIASYPFFVKNYHLEDVFRLIPEVLSRSPLIILLPLKHNFGFSGGNNVGIEYALFGPYPVDFVFLLNNDARPDPNCITASVEVAQREDAAIVGAVVKSEGGSKILFAGARFPRELFIADRLPLPQDSYDYWHVDRVEGAAMLIRRDLLIKRKMENGYFLDPKLFMYCEELEFCIRAREWGYKVLMARNALVYHKVASSSGGGGSALSYYYLTRNRILLARKLLPWWLRLLFHAWYTPSRLMRALQKRIEGRSSVSVAILEGLLDGYKGMTGKWKRHIS